VTATLTERPPEVKGGEGGAPARRAIVRWAWRLFRREWRRQALILVLLVVAVAATVVGLGVASNATNMKADPVFGTSNTIISIPGPVPDLSTDLSSLQRQFGPIEVIEHDSVTVPGSVSAVDLRAQDPAGRYGHVTLRLDRGRYPKGAGEVALTSGVADLLGLHIGDTWTESGRALRVVGIVENPLNLLDEFALVAPGQVATPAQVTVLTDGTQQQAQNFTLPSGRNLSIGTRGTGGKTAAEALILVLGSLALVFVGLLGVAGFTVLAHRRLRALGMLGALGATDKQVRLALLANGAVVGATSAVAGVAVGLLAWAAFVPTLQSSAEHRVDVFALPWWAIAAAMVLTFVTAVAAAWWPARTMARIPIVAALSERPPKPQPGHRFAAVGGAVTATGITLLAFADGNRAGFIIAGTVATAIGPLFLAPVAIGALAAVAGRMKIAARLALRDLARFQARSGAALGAITLAIGISATIAISASAAQSPTSAGNLPDNQLVFYIAPFGPGTGVSPVTPPVTAAQQQSLTSALDQLRSAIGANLVLALDELYDPQAGEMPAQPGGPQGVEPAGYAAVMLAQITSNAHGQEISDIRTLYAATPAVLAHYGIASGDIDPNAVVISGSKGLSGMQLFSPTQRGPRQGSSQSAQDAYTHPRIQTLSHLPPFTSAPGTLMTTRAAEELGLSPIPAAWLIQTPHKLTAAQIATARRVAASTGLYMETRTKQASLAPLRNWSTAAGILLALGVLGMTIGLIRSETAKDLRTLAATGASSTTRRTLTGVTAGALALLGALLGTIASYAALMAWYRSNLTPLDRVPWVNLVLIVVGLPVVAAAGGWLFAGREPAAMARSPLE
jgi:putative ABC transport system permease protein